MVYGLRQVSRACNDRINQFLTTHNLKQNTTNSFEYHSDSDNQLIVIMFIDDDLCCCCDDQCIDYVLTTINNVFETKINDPDIYVGLQIERDCSACLIYIHQQAYCERILCEYGFFESSVISTPADSNSSLCAIDSAEIESIQHFPFVNVVGSLQFASISTCSNITYSVRDVARFKSKFTYAHFNAVKSIFRYIRTVPDFKPVPTLLATFSDATRTSQKWSSTNWLCSYKCQCCGYFYKSSNSWKVQKIVGLRYSVF